FANLPRDKNKVLILEPSQMGANWQLGMLHNDFVRALVDEEERIRSIPNFIVLCAADVDQRCWASRIWRQTVFGHFLIQGLRGAASDENNDGRLNAWEVFSYLSPNVQRWVRDNRDETQTPLLLPRGDGQRRARGMDLTVVRSAPPAE